MSLSFASATADECTSVYQGLFVLLERDYQGEWWSTVQSMASSIINSTGAGTLHDQAVSLGIWPITQPDA